VSKPFKPYSFEVDACKQFLGHERCLVLEADGRAAAESHRDRWAVWREEPTEGLIKEGDATYMQRIEGRMERIVWGAAFRARKNRLDRIPDKDYFLC
jgi:hypothetical protein